MKALSQNSEVLFHKVFIVAVLTKSYASISNWEGAITFIIQEELRSKFHSIGNYASVLRSGCLRGAFTNNLVWDINYYMKIGPS